MIDPSNGMSIRHQCKLFGLNRSTYYRPKRGESEQNLLVMHQIDKIHLVEPTFGVLRMQDALKEKGYSVNVKRVRRLMRKMGIEVLYPKRNLSKLGLAQYIHPYLLRNRVVSRPNEVWGIDITYIAMASGFMYLTGIIDHYSRYIVGWDIGNSLAAEHQTILLARTIEQFGKPDIINSDQGSQYTCANWVNYLKTQGIQISMDGKGRATDNCYIERFFRTLKWDHVYLYPADNGWMLYNGVSSFINKYHNRSHQGIERRKPIDLYTPNQRVLSTLNGW